MSEQPGTTEQTGTAEVKIARRSSSRATARKPKKSQLPFGLIAGVVFLAFGIYLATIDPQLSLFWVIGLSFGFILQKARFCFTASLRDPVLTGSTSVTKAVLVAFAITSIVFTAIQYGAYIRGVPMHGFIFPISLGTIVGAFIFGIGMVIAGGCASGTLMRVGEGFGMQILALFFFVVGSLWGAADRGWWELHFYIDAPTIFLPDVFGWVGAIAVQLLLIAALYILADKWGSRKQKSE